MFPRNEKFEVLIKEGYVSGTTDPFNLERSGKFVIRPPLWRKERDSAIRRTQSRAWNLKTAGSAPRPPVAGSLHYVSGLPVPSLTRIRT